MSLVNQTEGGSTHDTQGGQRYTKLKVNMAWGQRDRGTEKGGGERGERERARPWAGGKVEQSAREDNCIEQASM